MRHVTQRTWAAAWAGLVAGGLVGGLLVLPATAAYADDRVPTGFTVLGDRTGHPGGYLRLDVTLVESDGTVA